MSKTGQRGEDRVAELSWNKRRWIEPLELKLPVAFEKSVAGHPLVAQALYRRGIQNAIAARAFLDPLYYRPSSPEELPAMDTAVERLAKAIHQHEKIAVWGDFDVDGQTSTTLLVAALRDLGGVVDYHIPVRANESHGVNIPHLEQLLEQGAQLVLTCDTGVGAHDAVGYAKERGIDFVITDHHDLPPALPEAVAVVNPNRLPEEHPLRTLPGVGVAYKLAEVLYQRLGREGEVEQYLDLVALGIVADVALQRGDTRYLLQRGLEALRNTQRLGLQAMMQKAEVNPAHLTEEHIGFVLGPRLNALGRLGDANPVVELLTTRDRGRAQVMANQLEGLNAHRKWLTDQVLAGALAQIQRDPGLLRYHALVLAHSSWPAGVVGIVASRLVERFHKPVILISSPPGQLARGSARSIDGVDISAAIADQHALLSGYGGHPMAAGLAIDPDHISEFRRGISRSVARQLSTSTPEAVLSLDGYLPLAALSLELVEDLERLAPFGAGNPPLALVSEGLTLVRNKRIGRNKEHLLLTLQDSEGFQHRVFWWQGASFALPGGRFDLAYTVRTSTYRGLSELQIEWLDAYPLAGESAESSRPIAKRQVVDHRGEASPRSILERLLAENEVLVWAEGEARGRLKALDRTELAPTDVLVVWTIPPGPDELKDALDATGAHTVILFAEDPEMDDARSFLGRLAGIVKSALIEQPAQLTLSRLAAGTAQRRVAVRVGLEWLQARGICSLSRQSGDRIWLSPEVHPDRERLNKLHEQLSTLLAESAAYRRYYLQVEKDLLFGNAGG